MFKKIAGAIKAAKERKLKEKAEIEKKAQLEELRKEYLRYEFPKSIGISLSEFECIYRCRMCPQYSDKFRNIVNSRRIMDFETFKVIVDQIPDEERISVEISSMNETLMCKDLEKYISYFKEKRPKPQVVIATNGRLLNEERAKSLINSCLDVLSFSLDAGSKESYKWLCGSDDYELVCENLRRVVEIRNSLKLDKPKIQTHIIGIKELSHEFQPFVEKWSKIVDFAYVRNYGNWGGLVSDNGCTPLDEVPEKRYPCAWLWCASKILSNGNVVKCFIHPYSNGSILGNIKEKSLKEIWKGEKVAALRKLHEKGEYSKVELCQTCNVWSLFPDIWSGDGEEK